jgi:hypothetical protein
MTIHGHPPGACKYTQKWNVQLKKKRFSDLKKKIERDNESWPFLYPYGPRFFILRDRNQRPSTLSEGGLKTWATRSDDLIFQGFVYFLLL